MRGLSHKPADMSGGKAFRCCIYAKMETAMSQNNELPGKQRYFVAYTGVRLPFKLINELTPEEIHNRNTYFRGYFDEQERIMGFDKLAYSEIELAHRYTYHDNGKLRSAEITDIDGETRMLIFEAGDAA